MAAVFGDPVNRSRVRLALRLLTDLTTEHLIQLDRTDHVSPCPQSAGAAVQVRADCLRARVLKRPSKRV